MHEGQHEGGPHLGEHLPFEGGVELGADEDGPAQGGADPPPPTGWYGVLHWWTGLGACPICVVAW